jgi:ammonium transporter, Amt family
LKSTRIIQALLIAFSLAAFTSRLPAQEVTDGQAAAVTAPSHDSGNTAWILVSSALVLLMTVPALAMFYGGMVNKKNMLSTMSHSYISAVIVSILWVLGMYSLVFNGNAAGLIGDLKKAFFEGVGTGSVTNSIPEFVFIVYQLTFAIITVSLISGAVAERMNFLAWIIFAAVWSLVVYAPLAHWVWGGGWLTKTDPKGWGALDFAGGVVVHISSGVSGLVAALVLGKRQSFKREENLPGNIPYTVIGAGLLWFGWFGFNAGSAIASNGLAGSTFLVTNTAAVFGSLTWMIIEWVTVKKPSMIGITSGLVAGLAAVTPASGFVDVKAAIAIGIVAAILCYLVAVKVKKALKYDDSLDAFGIHGVSGIWGTLATGLFANPAVNTGIGLLYGNPAQLGMQGIAILAAIVLSVVGTLFALFIARLFTKLRVDPKMEAGGLDMSIHGETAE